VSQPPAAGVGETIFGEEGNAVGGALATVFAHIVTDPNAQRSTTCAAQDISSSSRSRRTLT
jgi:hypothetical protein